MKKKSTGLPENQNFETIAQEEGIFCINKIRTIEVDGRKFGVRSFFPIISEVSTKDKILQLIDFENSER